LSRHSGDGTVTLPEMATDAATPAVRTALEAERTILQRQLEELGVSNEVGSFDANFADSSQVTAERGETEALVASLVESLRATEYALFQAGIWDLRNL
jgi:hypothetical protein